MIKASLVHKGAFIRSIIVRSISTYNNDFDIELGIEVVNIE